MISASVAATNASLGEEFPPGLFTEMSHAEILALSAKPIVDLGQYVISTMPKALPRVIQSKLPGSTEISDIALETNAEDEIILTAHEIVMAALREHLGEDLFTRSTVYFSHRDWGVKKDQAQTLFSKVWHVDGFPEPDKVKATVIYCDKLPPSILHNSVQLSDFGSKGELKLIQGVPITEATTVVEELLEDHLLLTPNIPHRAKTASRWTPHRRFIRWSAVDSAGS